MSPHPLRTLIETCDATISRHVLPPSWRGWGWMRFAG